MDVRAGPNLRMGLAVNKSIGKSAYLPVLQSTGEERRHQRFDATFGGKGRLQAWEAPLRAVAAVGYGVGSVIEVP
jgi:hypothetical protein